MRLFDSFGGPDFQPPDAGPDMALRQVVIETEALCVRVIDRPDGPRQVVDLPLDWDFPYYDLSDVADPQSKAKAWMMADLARPVAQLSERDLR